MHEAFCSSGPKFKRLAQGLKIEAMGNLNFEKQQGSCRDLAQFLTHHQTFRQLASLCSDRYGGGRQEKEDEGLGSFTEAVKDDCAAAAAAEESNNSG